jgi:4a-hydroxytetrahydrobiopterin dehydratase
MTDLTKKHCLPCEGGIPALAPAVIAAHLEKLAHWKLAEEGKQIQRYFHFSDFYQTMAFVNAVAWIANQENHHPDLEVGYNYCRVKYSTHAIDGLTENDFICAAKVENLIS